MSVECFFSTVCLLDGAKSTDRKHCYGFLTDSQSGQSIRRNDLVRLRQCTRREFVCVHRSGVERVHALRRVKELRFGCNLEIVFSQRARDDDIRSPVMSPEPGDLAPCPKQG